VGAAPRRPRRPTKRLRPHLDPGAARLIIDDVSGPGAARARHRFEAAFAAGPADGAAPGDEEAMTALATAAVRRIGEIPYGSNAVFLLELEAELAAVPGEPLRAIYKPMRGERALWDFPRNTLFLREAAAYLVDAGLGMGHVPPTALRDGPFGPGSAQLFVHASEQSDDADRSGLESELWDVAALDVLINNADRKRSHLMADREGRVRAIDNALTFLPYPRQRTALISLGGERLPKVTAARVQALAGDPERLAALRERLARLLSVVEIDAFGHRVEELAADPTYPLLDDWEGRPFEWW